MIVVCFAMFVLTKLYIQPFLLELFSALVSFFARHEIDVFVTALLSVRWLLNEMIITVILTIVVGRFLINRGVVEL